jgi:hypothetical protein
VDGGPSLTYIPRQILLSREEARVRKMRGRGGLSEERSLTGEPY